MLHDTLPFYLSCIMLFLMFCCAPIVDRASGVMATAQGVASTNGNPRYDSSSSYYSYSSYSEGYSGDQTASATATATVSAFDAPLALATDGFSGGAVLMRVSEGSLREFDVHPHPAPPSATSVSPQPISLAFSNGSCYAFKHASDGSYLSNCADCIPGYPQSVVASGVVPLTWNVWCAEDVHGSPTNNSIMLRSNYSNLVLAASTTAVNGSNATDNYPLVLLADNATNASARWSWTFNDSTNTFGTLSLVGGPPGALLGLCRACAWNATYPNVDALMPDASAEDADVQFSLVKMI